ncbi:MAG: hypothetical protein JNL82_15610 [Myxococcales bacterium]|nr:hypothetical protein [Myxococcales bacterium]
MQDPGGATEGGRRQGPVDPGAGAAENIAANVDPPDTASARADAWRAAGLVAAGVVLLLATRAWHPIAGLGNADIAGILYEADLLRAGGVPYVDAIDMKPPGTFFVFAGVFAAFARSLAALEAAYVGWCLLAAPAVWLAARALYGRVTTAGAAVLLYLATIGVFDLNYSAWMATAYAWAFACLIAAIRGGRLWLHAAAGACAGLALALKGHAVVLAPVFALVWWWGHRRGEPGARAWAWLLWPLGAGLGLLPLLAWFASRGALAELLAALLPIAEAADYAARVRPEGLWWLRSGKILLQHARVFPLHTLLAAAVLVGALWARRARRSGDVLEDRFAAPLAPQVILWVMSVIGCGLGGMRYYIHYLPQYLPALALLAVHPLGLAWWRRRKGWGLGLSVGVALVATTLVAAIPLGRAAAIDYRGSKNAAKAGEFVRRRTTPDERVLVWGWAGWAAYFHSERRSPSAIFKVLGQVTEYNQNGMFTRSRSADFKPGPHADRLLADFKRSPPAFVVKAAVFFPGVKKDPMKQFKQLDAIFRRDYVLARKFGRLHVYEHRERRARRGVKGR